MTDESLALLHQVIDAHSVQTLDLSGGASEMHPRFREIVRHARREGLRVIDRCNLTILSEPGYDDLGEFLAQQGVEVSASLPCYSRDNVYKQRGTRCARRQYRGPAAAQPSLKYFATLA